MLPFPQLLLFTLKLDIFFLQSLKGGRLRHKGAFALIEEAFLIDFSVKISNQLIFRIAS